MTAPDPLVAALRNRRRQLGISQQLLARRIGRTQTAVSYWESGARIPTTMDALALAEILDCDIELKARQS